MKLQNFVASGLALGLAAVLVHPSGDASAFTLLGYSLGTGQRDFRLFNNFSDPTSNDNTQARLQFPGALGAEQAVWKGAVEWGSTEHGSGQGDPQQSIGDGGANFDAIWMGNASAIGNSDHNVVSAISSCSSGTIAYMEGPSNNGWRIRFCDGNFQFDDGPNNVGGRMCIQNIMVHEYGHALGLGHSSTTAATMYFASSSGSTAQRSIHPDDISGVQFIYGVASASKPVIWRTDGNGGSGTLTIFGSNFHPSDNDIWFTNGSTTLASVDPRIIASNIPSTGGGTRIDVTIPAGAGVGDIIIKTPASGGASMSNAFPTDHVGVLTSDALAPFQAYAATPDTVEALDPGTAQSVTISGYQLDSTTSIEFNSVPVPSSSWTAVNDETLTIDLPLGVLGTNTLELNDGAETVAINITVVEASSPKLELGTGDPANVVPDGSTMNIVVAGTVGTAHRIYYSTSNVPSSHPVADFDMGNNFTNFFFGAIFTIGSDGYTQFSAPVTFAGGSPTVFYSQSIDITTPPSPKFGVSNLQSVTLTP